MLTYLFIAVIAGLLIYAQVIRTRYLTPKK